MFLNYIQNDNNEDQPDFWLWEITYIQKILGFRTLDKIAIQKLPKSIFLVRYAFIVLI